MSGDFQCKMCENAGERETRMAAMLPAAPYYCIVVGNDEWDESVIKELEKGIMPVDGGSYGGNFRGGKKGFPLKRLGARNDRGHRRSGAISGGRAVQVDARRRSEKRDVLGKLQEEMLMEQMSGMGL